MTLPTDTKCPNFCRFINNNQAIIIRFQTQVSTAVFLFPTQSHLDITYHRQHSNDNNRQYDKHNITNVCKATTKHVSINTYNPKNTGRALKLKLSHSQYHKGNTLVQSGQIITSIASQNTLSRRRESVRRIKSFENSDKLTT